MLRYWHLSAVCVLAGGMAQAQTDHGDQTLDRAYRDQYAADSRIPVNPIAPLSLNRSPVASADRFSSAPISFDPLRALQTIPHGERLDIDANLLGLHRPEELMSSRDVAALDVPATSPANSISEITPARAFAPPTRIEHDSSSQPVIREGDRLPEHYRP